jgi:hypothetical protein
MNYLKSILILVFLIPVNLISKSEYGQDHFWQASKNNDFSTQNRHQSVEYYLDENLIISFLIKSPHVKQKGKSETILSFPTPKGEIIYFEMYESPVMPEKLSEKYPSIKTFTGRGVENPTDRVSVALSKNRLKVLILGSFGRIFITPELDEKGVYQVSYFENHLQKIEARIDCSPFDCECMIKRSEDDKQQNRDRNFPYCVGEPEPCYSIGDTLVTFRYAGILTAEANNAFADGTVEGGLGWIAAMANQVNLVWVRELSFRLVLIENSDVLIYTDDNPTPELFTAYDMYTELPRVLIHLNEVIGPGGYGVSQENLLWEYGAVFNTGYGGGLAYVPGSTSANLPSYAVHIHEIGHNLGSGHNCTVENGWKSSFGGTAMCNRGNTLPGSFGDQYSSHTIDIAIRYQQDMFSGVNYDYQRGWIREPTENIIPGVMVQEGGFYIPKDTPFILEGSAIDGDEDDQLTYSWEQNDASNISFSPPDFPPVTGPLFCSIDAFPEGKIRYFPYFESILANNDYTGYVEKLPFAEREMNMRLLVRDNNLYSGAFTYKNVQFNVDEDAGPFRVTSQFEEEIWETGSTQIITWDVANTDNPNSVNCSNVDIILINENWNNFNSILAENIPNTGSANITVPVLPTLGDFRIMVKSSDNIFFDVNESSISIVNSQNAVVSIDTAVIQLSVPSDSILIFDRDIGNVGEMGSVLIYESIVEINRPGDGYLSFDGQDDYVDLGANILSGDGNFSISLWVKSLSTYAVIIQQRNGGFNGEYQLNFDGNGKINFWTYRNGYQWSVTSTDSYNDNDWHHIVIVQDVSINGGRIYIDGNEIGTNSNGVVYLDGNIHTYLGADMRDWVNYLFGDINDVHIFNGVLSESDINILFNHGFGFNTNYDHDGFTGSEYLAASYPMISMQGDTLFDISENGHDGFIGGAEWEGELTPVPNWMTVLSESHWLGYNEFEPISLRIDPTGLETDIQYTGSFIVISNTDFSPIDIPVELTVIDEIQLTEISVSQQSNWNLVGLPVTVSNPNYAIVFPESVEGTLYSYDGAYQLETDLVLGDGFWLRFAEEGMTTITGEPLNEIIVNLIEGWNLISGPSQISTINDPDGIVISGTLYGFGEGYINSYELIPGYGYWIKSYSDGEISLTSSFSLSKTKIFHQPENLNTLTVNTTSLFFGNKIEVENPLSFSLPPKPPEGSKDVRFSGNTKLCTLDECVIEVMNDGSPLTFVCEIIDGEVWEIVPVIANQVKLDEAIFLTNDSKLTLDLEAEKWILRKTTSPKVPTEFALFPAHPNPFNPVTTIRFSVPELSEINVSIYDIQGRLVETLVDENLSSGNHSVQWNASGFSSGVYFLKLESSDYSQIEKLMLLK